MSTTKQPTYLKSKTLARKHGAPGKWAPTAKGRAQIHRAYKRRWRNRLERQLRIDGE